MPPSRARLAPSGNLFAEAWGKQSNQARENSRRIEESGWSGLRYISLSKVATRMLAKTCCLSNTRLTRPENPQNQHHGGGPAQAGGLRKVVPQNWTRLQPIMVGAICLLLLQQNCCHDTPEDFIARVPPPPRLDARILLSICALASGCLNKRGSTRQQKLLNAGTSKFAFVATASLRNELPHITTKAINSFGHCRAA